MDVLGSAYTELRCVVIVVQSTCGLGCSSPLPLGGSADSSLPAKDFPENARKSIAAEGWINYTLAAVNDITGLIGEPWAASLLRPVESDGTIWICFCFIQNVFILSPRGMWNMHLFSMTALPAVNLEHIPGGRGHKPGNRPHVMPVYCRDSNARRNVQFLWQFGGYSAK